MKIALCGDLVVRRSDYASIFLQVDTLLAQHDLTVANLEAPICGSLAELPGKVESGGRGHLRMPPGNERALKDRFDVVTLANNHMMDYGGAGLDSTMDALDVVDVLHVGAGLNLDEAHKAVIIERDGTSVGFLSYTSVYVPGSYPATDSKPGVAVIQAQTGIEFSYNLAYQPGTIPRVLSWADSTHKQRMISDVEELATQCDIVVVAFHWGQTARGNARASGLPEELASCTVADYQEELGRAAIDAGADVIMGHHPHELQGFEVYNGGLICYSLGNFAFEGSKPPLRAIERDSLLAVIDFAADSEQPNYSFVPLELDAQMMPIPVSVSSEAGERILHIVHLHSERYGTTFEPGSDGSVRIG